MTTQVTKRVNGTDFLAPKHHIKNTHSHAQEVKALRGNWWLKWLGMTDWRLSQLHTSCPEALSSLCSPAASPAAVLWQEAGSVQACQCPVLCPSNDTNCSLLTAEEQKKKPQQHKKGAFWLFFFIHSSTFFFLFEPCSSPLPCLVSHW